MSDIEFVAEGDEDEGQDSAPTFLEVYTQNHAVIFPNHPGTVAADFGVALLRVCMKTGVVEGCGPDQAWHELGKRTCELKAVK